jgi:VIT1/CCC1 family predicted Fe2+/Mn2+ transporter
MISGIVWMMVVILALSIVGIVMGALKGREY